MLHLLIAIAGIIITIFFVVGTHEFGHFMAARLVGVKVLTFSIGFGKKLFSWRDKKGTEFVFALIPLGGYVRMVDENEGPANEADLPRAYNRQPFYKKFIIVAAGPLSNFFWAIILYWLIFTLGYVTIKPVIGDIKPNSIAAVAGLKPLQEIISIDQQPVKTWTNVLFKLLWHTGNNDQMQIGVLDPGSKQQKNFTLDLATWKMDDLNPDPLVSLGITPYEPPVKLEIGYIRKNSPAAQSRLTFGDKLIAINNEKITDWAKLAAIVQAHPDQQILFTIERNSKKMEVPVMTGSIRNWNLQKTGILGIGPFVKLPASMEQKIQYSPWQSLPAAAQETLNYINFNLLLFGKMVTGKLSLQSLGGPITIFDTAGDSLNYGILPFLNFLAFLSVAIGVINIFPIPGLDGGHLLFQLIETIIRRPIPINVVVLAYRLGFAFLFLIMLRAFINDVLRMF
jgi:regulator of sigma E protease